MKLGSHLLCHDISRAHAKYHYKYPCQFYRCHAQQGKLCLTNCPLTNNLSCDSYCKCVCLFSLYNKFNLYSGVGVQHLILEHHAIYKTDTFKISVRSNVHTIWNIYFKIHVAHTEIFCQGHFILSACIYLFLKESSTFHGVPGAPIQYSYVQINSCSRDFTQS